MSRNTRSHQCGDMFASHDPSLLHCHPSHHHPGTRFLPSLHIGSTKKCVNMKLKTQFTDFILTPKLWPLKRKVKKDLKGKMTSWPNMTLLGVRRKRSMFTGLTRLPLTASKRMTLAICEAQRPSLL